MDETLRLMLTLSAVMYAACIAKAYWDASKVSQMTQKDRMKMVTSLFIVIGTSLAMTSELHFVLKLVMANALLAVLVKNYLDMYHGKERKSRHWFAAYFLSAFGLAAASLATLFNG